MAQHRSDQPLRVAPTTEVAAVQQVHSVAAQSNRFADCEASDLQRAAHPAVYELWDGYYEPNSSVDDDCGLAQRGIDRFRFAKTVYNALRLRSEAGEINNVLRQGQSGELGQVVKLSDFWSGFRGEFGGLFYDLSGSDFGRETARRLSAISLTITSAIDDLIDEARLPREKQVELIEMTLTAITQGTYKRSDYPVVNCITSLAHDLHIGISAAPAPEIFNQCYLDLADAAIEQLGGESSDPHSVTRRVGGGTLAVSIGVIYAFNPELDRRFLDSARHFGACWQYRDDRDDVDHDREQGIVTAMTATTDGAAARAEADRRSHQHMNASLDCLMPDERSYIRSLENILQFGLKVKGALKGHREFPGRSGG